MAITPVNYTRVSNNLQTLSLLDSLRRNTVSVFQEQNRLSSGLQLNAPSEDPALAAKITRMSELLDRQDQILANIQSADSFLSASDTAIGEISDLLLQAQSIASEMVNSTSDQSMRDSQAELVKGIIDQLVVVGNRTYAGRYLFGGQSTTAVPFTQDNGGVEYRGDTSSLNVHVDETQDLAMNLTGAELFGCLTGQVTGCVDWDPAMSEDTRLVDLDGAAGRGVSLGAIRISLAGANTGFVVDLRSAATVGDVIDKLNAAAADAGLTVGAGQQFNATINAAGNGIDLSTSAGVISVAEVSEGVTARDLGLVGTAVGTLSGTDLNPQVTGLTRIADLFGGTGAALGSIQIENGSLSQTIDLSGATTVQQLLNRLNSAGVEVVASINDEKTGINIASNMSGFELHIGEAGGDTAELLGIRSLYGGTALSDLNGGEGVRINTGEADFRIQAKDGSTYDVSLDGASTIQDVLDKINAATGGNVTASLASNGNGIRLVDSTGGAGTLSVERLNYSYAIDDLGLTGKEASGAETELVGDDTNGIETDSVFSALIGLYNALVQGGDDVEQAITAAGEKLDTFVGRTSRIEGVVGARSKAMTTRAQLTKDAVVATKSLLSDAKDLDYTEAITKFQQAQTTLQANLLTGSKLMQLSLMDFISV